MTRWFRNLRLFQKLLLGFAGIGVVCAALGAFSIVELATLNGQVADITGNWMPSLRSLLEMKADLLEVRTFELAAANFAIEKGVEASKDTFVDYRKRSAAIRADYDSARTRYLATPQLAEEAALWSQAEAAIKVFWEEADRFFGGLDTRSAAETSRMVNDLRVARQKANAALIDDISYNVRHSEEAALQSAAVYHRALVLIIVGTLVAVAAGLLLGWRLGRGIAGPIARATEVAEAISQGKIDNDVVADSQDEAGRLLRAMAQMQSSLQAVVVAQSELAHQHEQGWTDFRMDAQRLPGAFGSMAKQVNELVAAHIAVNLRVVEVVSAYARGDVSQSMDRLPGKRAETTAAVDSVKQSIEAISSEVNALVSAAARGDFSARGDEQRYAFAFREMVEGLNQLMQTSDSGLSEVDRVLAAIAAGDLTESMSGSYQGTFAQLQEDTNATVASLRSIIGEIREATEAIKVASSEIAAGNSDLSARTEQQAASLEETAASMEELTATVQQNTEHARQANSMTASAGNAASEGGQIVAAVVQTMDQIHDSSKRITDIIGVIDGIAFQTNILALNAAVEAARAGEQGRGFAVVASEVRSLAQRSADAARQIKVLIGASVECVDSGTLLADRAGATMQDIVSSVKSVSTIIGDISRSSREQSDGVVQVGEAITQMDQVTQQNAALVEESAASAQGLREQAGQLVAAVAVFRVAALPA